MTRPLWTSEEAAKATGGRAEGHWSALGISIDTRSLKPGDLFVALKDIRDGHDFVPNAYEAGAAACLVSRDVHNVPALQVDDTLTALEHLGLAARARTDAFCSAVTGSVGKTSIKEMLAQIFRASGPAHWSDKSFNNHWGVPLTLARMPQETRRAIFEIGMSTPGEIEPRSRMAQPHAAMITKIAPAHLEGVGSIEGVAKEKSAIFAGLLPDGHAILPVEDRFFDFLKNEALNWCPSARIYTFGAENGDGHVLSQKTDGLGTTFELKVFGEVCTTRINAVGDHWGVNLAAALVLAVCSGLSLQEAAETVAGYQPPDGRGSAEYLDLAGIGRVLLVNDAYNANPESMRAALTSFAERDAGRKVILLGEMKELGEGADELHKALAPAIRAASPAAVILSGEGIKPLMSELSPDIDVHWVAKAKESGDVVKSLLTNGDALLIKGSNGSGVHTVARALRDAVNASGEGEAS